jgi:hypothetical protein
MENQNSDCYVFNNFIYGTKVPHEGINLHGVPEDKLQMMKDRFEIKL